jgi:deaminated glutathione amidase
VSAVAVLRVGVVQMCSGLEPEANIAEASRLIRGAADQGAGFVATPEMTNIIEPRRALLVEKVREEAEDASVAALAALARELGIWLSAGSLALRSGDRLVNRSLLYAPDGQVKARYDKIHLFDVMLPNGESYRESSSYDGGNEAVSADIGPFRLGLSICYDLRFPQLYLALASAGAAVLNIPSAFTRVTGEAHWHVLLRTRAIETGSFVIAAAQGGRHASGRETYGHSLVVDPWGGIMAEAEAQPGVILADIDAERASEARARIPTLRHQRPITVEAVGAGR